MVNKNYDKEEKEISECNCLCNIDNDLRRMNNNKHRYFWIILVLISMLYLIVRTTQKRLQ